MSIPQNSQNQKDVLKDAILLPPDLEQEEYALSIGLTAIEFEQKHSEYSCSLLLKSGEWSKGILYLLNFGIKFVPYSSNNDTNFVGFLWSEIKNMYFFNYLLFIPTGLSIKLKNNAECKIITNKRQEILSFIEPKIK